MDIMIIVYAVLSYLIGSIPSGLIIGKLFFNTDVRQYGSKNIGATNTYRVIGLKAALPVFLCDALKGAAGVVLLSPYGPMFMILGGIATGLGVLIALSPIVALICFLVWGVIVYFTKLVSLGSIIAAALVPVLMYFTGESFWFVGFGGLAALFVIVRHWDNIKRLLAGNELKVERIKKD